MLIQPCAFAALPNALVHRCANRVHLSVRQCPSQRLAQRANTGSLLNVLYGLLVLPESLADQYRRPFSWRRANALGALTALRRFPVVSGFLADVALYQLAFTGVLMVIVQVGIRVASRRATTVCRWISRTSLRHQPGARSHCGDSRASAPPDVRARSHTRLAGRQAQQGSARDQAGACRSRA